MLIDATKTENGKGVLSRCKVCGRYFTWENNDNNRFFDVVRKRWRTIAEPEHCGSTVCRDFWQYYLDHKQKMQWDLDYAKHAYLQKRGIF